MKRIVKVTVIAVPSAVVCCAILALFARWQQSQEAESVAIKTQKIERWMLELVPAPSIADQTKLVSAMKAHPNPSFNPDLLPHAGADASGLATLFAAMKPDGAGSYSLILAPAPDDHDLEITEVRIVVGGNPPRVIRRVFGTFWRP